MAEFSVVTMVRDDPAIIERFARHHEALGAQAVFICFDGYEPPDVLKGPRRRLITINDAFWTDKGMPRPDALEARQHAAYINCLALCESEWLLVADCDEFVIGEGPVCALLDAVPDDIDAIRLRTAEAIWGPGDRLDAMWGSTHFRLAFESRLLWVLLRWPVYGLSAGFLRRGLIGHVGGKQFVRTGRGIDEIRAHTSFAEGRMVTRWADTLGKACHGFHIAHFDAIGLARWRAKWEKRVSGIGRVDHMRAARNRQLSAIAAAFEKGGQEPEKLFARFYRLDGWRYTMLRLLGLAFRRPVFQPDQPEEGYHGH